MGIFSLLFLVRIKSVRGTLTPSPLWTGKQHFCLSTNNLVWSCTSSMLFFQLFYFNLSKLGPISAYRQGDIRFHERIIQPSFYQSRRMIYVYCNLTSRLCYSMQHLELFSCIRYFKTFSRSFKCLRISHSNLFCFFIRGLSCLHTK